MHARLLIMAFDVTGFVVSSEHTKYRGFIITLTTRRIHTKRLLLMLNLYAVIFPISRCMDRFVTLKFSLKMLAYTMLCYSKYLIKHVK